MLHSCLQLGVPRSVMSRSVSYRCLSSSRSSQVNAPQDAQVPQRRVGIVALRHGIYSNIRKVPVCASTASDTKYNVISEALASQCGLKIHSWSTPLMIGSGSRATAIGKVLTEWKFEGERRQNSSIGFLVFPCCSRPVALGNDFLKSTSTMITNWHRLKTQITPAGTNPNPSHSGRFIRESPSLLCQRPDAKSMSPQKNTSSRMAWN